VPIARRLRTDGALPERTTVAGSAFGNEVQTWGRTVEISPFLGDDPGNVAEKLRISREPLDPPRRPLQSKSCREAEVLRGSG